MGNEGESAERYSSLGQQVIIEKHKTEVDFDRKKEVCSNRPLEKNELRPKNGFVSFMNIGSLLRQFANS